MGRKVKRGSKKGNYWVYTIFRGWVRAYELRHRWTVEEVERKRILDALQALRVNRDG